MATTSRQSQFLQTGVMKMFRNFTPHAIVLNCSTSFPSEGVARVKQSFGEFDKGGVCSQNFGEVEGLPDPVAGTLLIVSALVLQAGGREDLVAPATGHPDTVRNEKGHIVSVPGFVR